MKNIYSYQKFHENKNPYQGKIEYDKEPAHVRQFFDPSDYNNKNDIEKRYAELRDYLDNADSGHRKYDDMPPIKYAEREMEEINYYLKYEDD